MSATNIFRQYFTTIASAVTGVKTVKVGDGRTIDRMSTDSRSEDIYPCIFSLRPKYRLFDNGAHEYIAWFEVVFFVFVPGPTDDYDAQDAAYDQAETMAMAVLQQFKDDNNTRCLLEFNSVVCDPVSLMTVDSVFAYEVKCKLGLVVSSVIL